MTNEEIIEKIRITLAEEFEVDIEVIQPDAPLMETRSNWTAWIWLIW